MFYIVTYVETSYNLWKAKKSIRIFYTQSELYTEISQKNSLIIPYRLRVLKSSESIAIHSHPSKQKQKLNWVVTSSRAVFSSDEKTSLE